MWPLLCLSQQCTSTASDHSSWSEVSLPGCSRRRCMWRGNQLAAKALQECALTTSENNTQLQDYQVVQSNMTPSICDKRPEVSLSIQKPEGPSRCYTRMIHELQQLYMTCEGWLCCCCDQNYGHTRIKLSVTVMCSAVSQKNSHRAS